MDGVRTHTKSESDTKYGGSSDMAVKRCSNRAAAVSDGTGAAPAPHRPPPQPLLVPRDPVSDMVILCFHCNIIMRIW